MIFSFYRSALFSFLTFFLAAGKLQAQAPGATTAAKERKLKQGFVRFWNMLPKEAGELVLIKNDGSPTGVELYSAEPRNYYSGYIGVPVGRYALNVIRRDQPDVVLEKFDVLFRHDVYVTFLGSIVEGKLKVEMLDDTYDPTTFLGGQLVIHQQFANARVSISAGSAGQSQELSFGQTETLNGLPLKPLEIKMRATLADGKTQAWTTEVDLKSLRRAALLVIPDAYGRFRPRVAIVGNPQAPPPEADTQ